MSRVDELTNFNRVNPGIHTDNQTYVNATLWKDVTYGVYDMRLGVNYYLGKGRLKIIESTIEKIAPFKIDVVKDRLVIIKLNQL